MKYISFNMIRRKRTWCYLLVVLYPFICFYLWSSDKKAIRTIHEKQIISVKSFTTIPTQALRKKAYFHVNNDIEGPGKSSLFFYTIYTLFWRIGGWGGVAILHMHKQICFFFKTTSLIHSYTYELSLKSSTISSIFSLLQKYFTSLERYEKCSMKSVVLLSNFLPL